ncbi:MAG: LuxR family transcriptional regulator [Gemmatimonadota bacterium]
MFHDPAEPASHFRLLLAAVFLIITAGLAVDLVLDRATTVWSFHVLFEVTLAAFSLTAAAYLGLGWYRSSRQIQALRGDVEHSRRERDAWRARTRTLQAGMAAAAEEQFRAWALTPAERETALLLLRGYSHKRIAALTGRSDRTVRQHAVAVYRKAGLGGRSELSAFFLDGLLPPPEEATLRR